MVSADHITLYLGSLINSSIPGTWADKTFVDKQHSAKKNKNSTLIILFWCIVGITIEECQVPLGLLQAWF